MIETIIATFANYIARKAYSKYKHVKNIKTQKNKIYISEEQHVRNANYIRTTHVPSSMFIALLAVMYIPTCSALPSLHLKTYAIISFSLFNWWFTTLLAISSIYVIFLSSRLYRALTLSFYLYLSYLNCSSEVIQIFIVVFTFCTIHVDILYQYYEISIVQNIKNFYMFCMIKLAERRVRNFRAAAIAHNETIQEPVLDSDEDPVRTQAEVDYAYFLAQEAIQEFYLDYSYAHLDGDLQADLAHYINNNPRPTMAQAIHIIAPPEEDIEDVEFNLGSDIDYFERNNPLLKASLGLLSLSQIPIAGATSTTCLGVSPIDNSIVILICYLLFYACLAFVIDEPMRKKRSYIRFFNCILQCKETKQPWSKFDDLIDEDFNYNVKKTDFIKTKKKRKFKHKKYLHAELQDDNFDATQFIAKYEKIIVKMEAVALLFVGILDCKRFDKNGKTYFSKKSIVKELIHFIIHMTGKPLSSNIVSLYTNVLEEALKRDVTWGDDDIISALHNGTDFPPDLPSTPTHVSSQFSDFDTQALSVEDALLGARKTLNSFKDLKNSSLFLKLRHFYFASIALSILDTTKLPFNLGNYTMLEKESLNRHYNKDASYLELCMDTALFICEKGFQIYQSGSLQPIYHTSSTYVKWLEDANKITKTMSYLNTPDLYCKEFGEAYVETKFATFMDTTIEQGESIVQYASRLTTFERTKATNILNDIKMVKVTLFTKQACRQSRKAPFAMLICGDSGVCKSTFQDMLYVFGCQYYGLPTDLSNRYTITTAKHMDGMTSGTDVILIDDVAAKKPSLGMDPTMDYIIQLCNNVPFVAPMAALEDKGKVAFKGKLVIGSTNIRNISAHHYYQYPSAVQRRFPFVIEVSLKQEYKNYTDSQVNQAAVPSNWPSGYPDLWDIKTYKVVTKPADQGSMLAEHVPESAGPISLEDFLALYSKKLAAHDIAQDKAKNHMAAMQQTTFCQECKTIAHFCKCNTEIQSFEYIRQFLDCYHIQLISTYCKRSWFWTKYHILTLIFGIAHSFPFFNEWCCRTATNYFLYRYIGGTDAFDTYVMSNIGRRVQRYSFKTPLIILSIVSVLTVLYKVCSFSNHISKFTETQSNFEDTEFVPKPLKKERVNAWYKDEYELSYTDLSPTICCSSGMPDQKIYNKIQKNCVHIRCSTETKYVKTKAICIGGQDYIMNKHGVYHDIDCYVTVSSQNSSKGVNENISFKVKPSQWKHTEGDLIMLTLEGLPPRENIYDFIPQHNIKCKMNGIYLAHNEDGTHYRNSLAKITYVPMATLNTLAPMDIYTSSVDNITTKGDCGSVLVARTPQGLALCGMHVGLISDNTVATIVLSKDLIDPLLMKGTIIQNSAFEHIEAPGYPRKFGELHYKSVFRYIENGSARVYGSFVGGLSQMKSRVGLNPIGPLLGFNTPKYGKPVLSGWEPKRKAALDLVNPVTNLDVDILNQATKDYFDSVIKDLPAGSLDMLKVYGKFTAINGADGVAYVDKINRNTSAGLPFRKKKRHFATSIPSEHGVTDPIKFDPIIMDRVDSMLEKYSKGLRVHPVFSSTFKDEALPKEKIAMKKTRVFTAAPVDYTIIMRMFFLSSIRLIQNNRFAFESGAGTVAQSTEWQDIYFYLIKFGKNKIVAGDYKAYDKRMPAIVILRAFQILIDLCKLSGNFDKTQLDIMRTLAYDTAFPLVDYFGDLVEFYGGNPSGHPLTVIINSIANSIYMRYCFISLNPTDETYCFKDYVNLYTYGDDNIMGVSDDVEWFNHTAIAECLSNVDITYTMAEKTAESVPYIHINEASFLKRSFVYDKDIDAVICPLEFASIEKMLSVWVRSKTICEEEQIMATVSSANMEYFWYGKETYEAKQIEFREAISLLGLDDWVEEHVLPGYMVMLKRFWEASHQ